MSKTSLDSRITTAHPRVQLVLWNVTWNLLNHALPKDKGMELLVSCPICRLEDESTEHALLCYLRTRLIWRMVGVALGGEHQLLAGPFLDMVH